MTDMSTELADKLAIRELLAEYCFHIDNDRCDEMAALFTADGTWDTAFGIATGRPAIANQLRQIIALVPGPTPRWLHLCTNIVVRLAGDTAQVTSNWAVIEPGDGGNPRVGSTGAYQDSVVKTDGAWLFKYRKIERLIAPPLG